MSERKRAPRSIDFLWLTLGCLLIVFVGWRWGMPIAAWLSPVFLIRFFRNQDKWYQALIALPLIAVAGFINKTGVWDMDLLLEIALSVLVPIPLWIALFMDRFFARHNHGLLSTLVYPTVLTAMDFAFASLPLIGTTTSVSGTAFGFTPLAQLASVTGVWGITFVLSWFASTVNTLWDKGFDLRKAIRPVAVFGACVGLILVLGEARLALWRPSSPTVRVAGITVEHPRDYWGEIIDLGTPREVAHRYEQEIEALEEELFAQSELAAAGGAKVIFWSEGNGVLYEEDEAEFIRRAQAFARNHQVYFAPAVLVLHYGETSSDNKLLMITPGGEVAYSYTKTISWYATDSDGLIDVVDTPYGRIAATICFDMDFPAFIRQAARQEVDLMIVPAFDSEGIRPYHTYVGLFRGIEGGFSVVRQVNAGTSVAVDYQGNVLAYQDHFRTADRVMYADVPIQGVRTIYSVLGDWFAYLAAAGAVLLAGRALYAAVRPAKGVGLVVEDVQAGMIPTADR